MCAQLVAQQASLEMALDSLEVQYAGHHMPMRNFAASQHRMWFADMSIR
jgi:hypothetical protein